MKEGKIFCTGFQRTGTTSLNEALNLLGIPSKHTPYELYQDINHKVINKYRAFTDNPIPLIYKELDNKFTGSKFIHTLRDVDEWLKSVEWLFTDCKRIARWNENPLNDRMHKSIYGVTDFEEKIFRETYIKHNHQVLKYFANRPEDLLVINITKGDGWEKLCPFLNKEIPAQGFPYKNKNTPFYALKIWCRRRQPLYQQLKNSAKKLLR